MFANHKLVINLSYFSYIITIEHQNWKNLRFITIIPKYKINRLKRCDNMKITATTSYLKVEIADKETIIQGKMLTDGFIAFSDTMNYWEPPYEDIKINENIKTELINCLMKGTQHSDFKIIFTKESN